jgi:hypothetical protein
VRGSEMAVGRPRPARHRRGHRRRPPPGRRGRNPWSRPLWCPLAR